MRAGVVVPAGPVTLAEAIALNPVVRQSTLASMDDCALSAFFGSRFTNGWTSHPAARGTLFHRVAAEIMRELQRQRSNTIPVQVAEAILLEQARQRDVPAEEIVRVPLREMKDLRMAVRKFAKDNEFSADKIVDVEKRLFADVYYSHPDVGMVRRQFTGQLDVLLFMPPDEAVVVDFKDSWGLPPVPKERNPEDYIGEDDELRGLSFHGYFQQRSYALLVLKNYPAVQKVTLREFYPRFTKARAATVTRDRLPEIEEEFSIMFEQLDRAVMQGAPAWPPGWRETPEGRVLDIEAMGAWKPTPSRACGFCARSRDCPVDEDTRIEQGAPPATADRARRIAAELQVIERVRKVLTGAAKAYVEGSGEPIPVKDSKGRRVLGWFETKRGRRFGLFTPDDSDRGGHADLDRQLEESMREATRRARTERPRRRKTGKV